MNLCLRILKTIIDEEEPISTYKLSKKLNENFNSVKYNVQKLEDHKAILALEKEGNEKATYYVPNKIFTLTEGVLEFMTPVIRETLNSVEMNEDNAKFNFKLLLSLIINDIVVNNGKRENDL